MMYSKFLEEDRNKLLIEKRKLNIIRASRLLLFIFIAYLAYYLVTIQYNSIIFSVLIISTLMFSLLVNASQKLTKKVKILAFEIQFSERELSKTSTLYHSNGSGYIDAKHDYTYDLDVFGQGSIFHTINRTNTILGERALANFFINPDLTNIKNRQESIHELSESIEFRKKLYALGLLNSFSADSEKKLFSWINKQRGVFPKFYTYVLIINPILLVSSVIAYFIFSKEILLDISKYIALVNLTILGLNFKKLKSEIYSSDALHSSLFMLSDVLKHIEDNQFESEELKELKNTLISNKNKSSVKIQQLGKIYQTIYNVQNILSAVIFNAIFLHHIRALKDLDQWIQINRDDVNNYLKVIAEIEAISSLSNFKYNHPNFVFPKITQENILEMQDIGHPLIDEKEMVLNSIEFKESEFKILTGSNMSGKSTFLRSVGINILLANMGSVCFASKMLYKPLKLITSMRNNDSVLSKESYFMAEVNRLRYVFESIRSERVFLLLDEILKGTNSDDKLEGSRLILQKLVSLNQQGIIATHDLELCEMSEAYPDRVQNICFESEIINNTIHFDFKLNFGICKNKSASFLIKKYII